MSYRKAKFEETSITVNEGYEGETIEQKVERILTNGEPITDGAPIIYQERGEGVSPSYDIRTDRFDHAIEAMDKVTASKKATREEALKELNESKKKKTEEKSTENKGTDTEGEPIQGTSGQES